MGNVRFAELLNELRSNTCLRMKSERLFMNEVDGIWGPTRVAYPLKPLTEVASVVSA